MRWRLEVLGFVVICSVQSRGATVNEHQAATLSCSSSVPDDLISLSWTKKGGGTIFQYLAQGGADGITSEMMGHWERSGDWDIRIPDPTRHDNGTYQCIQVTQSSAQVLDADLLVKVPPTIPVIIEPNNLNLLVGKAGRLRCHSEDGIPRPEYTWYKDNVKLPDSHTADPSRWRNTTFRLERDPLNGNDVTVVFTQVTEADGGKYHCIAKSAAGEASGVPVQITIGKVSAASVIGIIFGVLFGIALIGLIVFMLLKKLGAGDTNSEYDEDGDDANDVMIENGVQGYGVGGVDYGGHHNSKHNSRGHHSLIV